MKMDKNSIFELHQRIRSMLDPTKIRLGDWTVVKVNSDGQVVAMMQMSKENVNRIMARAAERGYIQRCEI